MVGEQLVLSFMHQPVEPKVQTDAEGWASQRILQQKKISVKPVLFIESSD